MPDLMQAAPAAVDVPNVTVEPAKIIPTAAKPARIIPAPVEPARNVPVATPPPPAAQQPASRPTSSVISRSNRKILDRTSRILPRHCAPDFVQLGADSDVAFPIFNDQPQDPVPAHLHPIRNRKHDPAVGCGPKTPTKTMTLRKTTKTSIARPNVLRPGLGGIGDSLSGVYILCRHGDNAYEQDSQYYQTINAHLFDLEFHLGILKKTVQIYPFLKVAGKATLIARFCVRAYCCKISRAIRKQKTASWILI